MKYYLTILFFIYCSSLISAQELSFGEVNRRSLAYYHAQDWTALIALGDSALLQELDYYALRYRLGVAHYERANYWKSQKHFEKAYASNSEEPYLQEYLYYSYLFAGAEGQALSFAKNMEDTVQKKVEVSKYKFLDYVNVEGGAKIPFSTDSLSVLGYFGIGFGLQLGYHFRLYHEFNVISQDYKGLNYNQYEYYMRGNWHMGESWELIPAFRYLGIIGQSNFDTVNVFLEPMVGEQNYRELGLVGYLGLSKQLRRWKFKVHTGYMYRRSNNLTKLFAPPFAIVPLPPVVLDSTIQNNHFLQYGLGLEYRLPIGQHGLAFKGDFVAKQDFQTSDFSPIWELGIDYWYSYRLGLSLAFLRANSNNFLERDAAVFNNIVGDIDYRINVGLRYNFTPKVAIYGLYQYEKRYETYFDFEYNTFLLGLNIKL